MAYLSFSYWQSNHWDANCYIGHGSILRGDYGRIEIGDGTAVEEGVIVHAPPGDTNQIGKKVTIGHGAVVHGKHIGDGAVIGMGTVISSWSEIGEQTIVAEGCVVKLKQTIPPKVVVAENPAKIVRGITEKDKEFWNWVKAFNNSFSQTRRFNFCYPVFPCFLQR